MDYLNNGLTFLIAVSGVSTILIYIGKAFISKFFEAGLVKYQSNVQKEIEEYKNELSKMTYEHEIRFSKLHEERAEKIRLLYARVVDLEASLINATTIGQGPDYPKDLERDEICFRNIRDLIKQLDYDRIYFSNSTIEKFENIFKEAWEIVTQMRKVRRYADGIDIFSKSGRPVPEIYLTETDLWTDAYSRSKNEFRILKEELADDFRSMLGIV